jgi:hypothetical protein
MSFRLISMGNTVNAKSDAQNVFTDAQSGEKAKCAMVLPL